VEKKAVNTYIRGYLVIEHLFKEAETLQLGIIKSINGILDAILQI